METSSSSDTEEDILLIAAAIALIRRRRKSRRERRWWVRPWLTQREQLGAYHAFMQEILHEELGSQQNFVRMDLQHFRELLKAVSPFIEKKETIMRESISAGERLAVTLRFLATGDSYQSLCYLYKIGRQTLGKLIPETCEAIYMCLKNRYLKVPNSPEEWEAVAANFMEKLQYPNCIGVIDGKHIAIRTPPSGCYFSGYNEIFSFILFAIVDANCRFIMFDFGFNGPRSSDAGVFASSAIAAALEDNTLQMPSECAFPGFPSIVTPYVIVGDEAFPLRCHLMKPYPTRPSRGIRINGEQQIFNYKLSVVRQVSEKAFDILVNRFGVLASEMNLDAEKATIVTRACIALHNFLQTECDSRYAQVMERNSCLTWHRNLGQQAGNRNAANARKVRDDFCQYFKLIETAECQQSKHS